MIVQVDRGAGYTCLARRGMLYSETEGVDLLRLAPGERIDGRGREGLAEAWFVVRGEGRLDSAGPVSAGSLILRPAGTREALTASSELRILIVAVLPDELAGTLPARTPEYVAQTTSEGVGA